MVLDFRSSVASFISGIEGCIYEWALVTCTVVLSIRASF